MAAEGLLAEYPELRPFVLPNVRLTGIRIGAGAYGSVEEVAVPGAICAAKKIHDIFLDRSEIPAAEIRRATAQFVRECQLMSTLGHPNIVKFLGVAFFPGSRLPALVMERLLTSLHDLLDPETDPPPPPNTPKPFFPLSLKCSILHNVACGLAYLHERTPPVIHRDLSARNVLLNSGMVAKIVDLGVARIVPRMRTAATMTKGPGASVYMPPEASAPAKSNAQKSKYDASIDVFSLGVVAIFTIGEVFPCDPVAATYLDEETGLLVARTELQRRAEYMRHVNEQLRASGQLRGDHPLIRLIQQCLHNGPHKRPSIREVLRLLEEARAGARDSGWEEVQAAQTQPRNQSSERDLQSRVQELQQQLQSRNQENADLQSSVQELHSRNQAKDRELAEARQQLRQKEEELARQGAELTRAEETIRREHQQLRQKEEQLRSSEALVADFQKTLQQRDSEPTQRTKLTVQCHRKKTAPCEMFRGSATTDGRFAYFTPRDSNSVYQYECSTEKWEELPSCPYQNSRLVIIDRELTAVGGYDGSYTNKLYTLRQRKWVEKYPPMNTARSDTAVVTTSDGEHLIVIGGYVGGVSWTATVELFQVKSRRWYQLTDLPQPLQFPSATICGDLVHVVGLGDDGYSCSLAALPSSDKPIPPQSIPHLISWKPLPPLPLTRSTAATLCGQLVLIGGDRSGSPVNSIHQLVDGQWVEIGSMTSRRYDCLVASPSPDKIIIVGGVGAEDSVEECVVV
ncbi:Probable tyrosine-protein kinase DDB_G0283397 [Geodia barretti]|uniref:Probable tyrosine-protein kinase DDB_G0283397 n=1 Tax=Geodia barretti TaxID=519541 RepID=A0AA35QRJ2_GEOBA|nr:Probable tyrosine-protein kinase DDB_G0283397 [Geodia barretti]